MGRFEKQPLELPEMKDTATEIKNSKDIKLPIDLAEEGLKEKFEEITQNRIKRDKEIKNLNKNLKDMSDKKRKSSRCLIGIPERFNRGNDGKSLLKILQLYKSGFSRETEPTIS